MAVIKVCKHGREKGLSPQQRMNRWRKCGCSWYAHVGKDRINVGTDETRATIEEARLRLVYLQKGTLGGPGAAGLTALGEEVLAKVAASPKAKKGSLNQYRNGQKHLSAFFGDVRPADITPGDIDEWVDGLSRTLAPSTVGGHYWWFRKVMQHARRKGLIDVIPEPLERHLFRSRPRFHRVPWDRVEATIAALPDQSWRDLASFIVFTGLRIGEALAIERGAVAKAGHLFIPDSKTASGIRDVPLSEGATVIVERRLEIGTPRLWMFTVVDANPVIRQALKDSGAYARGRGWHTLRNAHAALLEAAGVPLREAAERMGHGTNQAQTFKYGWAPEQTPPARLDEARERLKHQQSPE
jgi:integrase